MIETSQTQKNTVWYHIFKNSKQVQWIAMLVQDCDKCYTLNQDNQSKTGQ